MTENNINQPIDNQQPVGGSVPSVGQPVKSNKIANLLQPLQPVAGKLKDLWLKIPEKLRKILRLVGIVFAIILFLMIVLSIVFNIKKPQSVKDKLSPVASPQPTPESEVITNPSRYATDSGVLKIEEDLRNLEKELDNLQVNETNLLPPRLDFDINFDK